MVLVAADRFDRYIIDPKFKKLDGAWYLHGRRIRMVFPETFAGNIEVNTMKKGKTCGLYEEYTLAPREDSESDLKIVY